jgi:23S rRNA pseudouridine2457 synthase
MIHKPINMVSQFVSSHAVQLLGSLHFSFPEGTHAIGRLDQNSEGLLLLTTNKKITRLLFQGVVPHERTYLVQVKGIVSQQTVLQLSEGIGISTINGQTYITSPCKVEKVDPPNHLFDNGMQLHPNVQTSWLLITLTEGRFHQVRKMVAMMNHRCIRLIRVSIESLQLGDMPPGMVIEISESDFFRKLNLDTASLTGEKVVN